MVRILTLRIILLFQLYQSKQKDKMIKKINIPEICLILLIDKEILFWEPKLMV